MKVTDKFRAMIRIIERMEKIETKRQKHKDSLVSLDAQLADLGVEWADITKSLSDDVAVTLPASFTQRALPEAPSVPSKKRRYRKSIPMIERKSKILKKLRASDSAMGIGQIMDELKLTYQPARVALAELIDEKKVIKRGKTRNTTYRAK